MLAKISNWVTSGTHPAGTDQCTSPKNSNLRQVLVPTLRVPTNIYARRNIIDKSGTYPLGTSRKGCEFSMSGTQHEGTAYIVYRILELSLLRRAGCVITYELGAFCT